MSSAKRRETEAPAGAWDKRAVRRVDACHRRAPPGGLHHDGVAHADRAFRDLAGVAAVLAILRRHGRVLRAQHVLHRYAPAARRYGGQFVSARHGLEQVEHRGAVVPGRAARALNHVVAFERAHRHRDGVGHAELRRVLRDIRGDAAIDGLVVVHEVDLVHGDDHVRHAQQRRDGEVAQRLLANAVPCIDEHHEGVGSRGSRDGVAGVLHVPGAVREDEGAARRGEVPVRDVDRDALLALGAQPVGEQREVNGLGAARAAHALYRLVGVGEDRLGVVEQATDER